VFQALVEERRQQQGIVRFDQRWISIIVLLGLSMRHRTSKRNRWITVMDRVLYGFFAEKV